MKLDEVVRLARNVGGKTTYPITSANQLANALGGSNATVRIGSKDRQVAEVQQIPAAYFPIESEEDFIAKITNVLLRSGEPLEDKLTWGTASGTPPSSAGSPPNVPPPKPRGVPSAIGSKQKP